MAWKIEISPAASAALDKLASASATRVLKFLYERIASRDDPRSVGKALVGSELAGLWRYRVGDYRILCRIEEEKISIIVVVIGHRSEVYRKQ